MRSLNSTAHGWCLLHPAERRCNGHDCARCGFDLDELKRREDLIRLHGLSDGLYGRHLKLTEGKR